MVSPHWTEWREPAYRRKTKHFTCAAQHGIYKNLLHHQLDQGELPKDAESLRQIACATIDEWKTYWPAIRDEFFVLDDAGGYVNKTAADVHRATMTRIMRKKRRGQAGAAARWAKHRSNQLALEPELPHIDAALEPPEHELPPIEAYEAEALPAKAARNPRAAKKKPKPKRAAPKRAAKPKRPARTASQKTRITDDWTPTSKDLEYAISKGFSRAEIGEVTVGFVRYWTGPDASGRGLKIDWHRTWCNWIDKELDHVIRRRRSSSLANGQKTGGVVTALNSMLARRRHNGSGHVNGGVRANGEDSDADEAGAGDGIGGWNCADDEIA